MEERPASTPADQGETPPSRPRKRRRWAWRLGLLGTGLALGAYAGGVEPYWIEVTRHQVAAPLATPLTIAHLTDLHTTGLGRRERKLLALLAAERPDLIVVTGDCLATSGTYDDVARVLSELEAPLGVWLVRGNWENWRRHSDETRFYREAGTEFLLNAARPVREAVWVVGFDDASWGEPDREAAFAPVPDGAYAIALFHAPAFFDQVADRCDLALAGHTHGGQVRLPLLPPLWMPRGCGRYVAGWYRTGDARLYVSRGIGTSVLPIRFRCRPELALITVGQPAPPADTLPAS